MLVSTASSKARTTQDLVPLSKSRVLTCPGFKCRPLGQREPAATLLLWLGLSLALGCRPVWVRSCFLKAQRPGLANVPDCDYLFAG